MRVVWVVFLFASAAACADVYKSINAEGEVVYSDTPAAGAEHVQMPPLPSYTPQPIRTLSRSGQPVMQQASYERFALISPAHEATIRNNPGTVEIAVQLAPELMAALGHRIQYYLDGVPHGAATGSTTLALTNVDRGEHQLSASVLDATGSIMMTTPVITVFVKRNSKLHGNREGSVTDNPGYITDNPNIPGDETFQPYRVKDIADYSGTATDDDDTELAEQPANPGYRNLNPNILSPNPNILSPNPGLINPPLPQAD